MGWAPSRGSLGLGGLPRGRPQSALPPPLLRVSGQSCGSTACVCSGVPVSQGSVCVYTRMVGLCLGKCISPSGTFVGSALPPFLCTSMSLVCPPGFDPSSPRRLHGPHVGRCPWPGCGAEGRFAPCSSGTYGESRPGDSGRAIFLHSCSGPAASGQDGHPSGQPILRSVVTHCHFLPHPHLVAHPSAFPECCVGACPLWRAPPAPPTCSLAAERLPLHPLAAFHGDAVPPWRRPQAPQAGRGQGCPCLPEWPANHVGSAPLSSGPFTGVGVGILARCYYVKWVLGCRVCGRGLTFPCALGQWC